MYKAILFDLDGTLVDTAADIADAANAMLTQLGLPERPDDDIRNLIGSGIASLVASLCPEESKRGKPEPGQDTPERLFLDAYGRCCCHRSRLYPGVMETLSDLRSRGIRMACVTNKATVFVKQILDRLALAKLFDLVVCGDTLERKKPAPDQLLYSHRQLAVSAGECLMVGDSVNDVQAASAADMAMICVTYGYHQNVDLAAQLAGDERLSHRHRLVERFSELPTAIENLPANR